MARPSALSRLAERRAQRGGKQRDFAAEILGAINQPETSEVADADLDGPQQPAEAPTPVAKVTPLAPAADPTAITVPVADPTAGDPRASAPAEDVRVTAPAADDPTVGRLSLAGLRARRKESGFDPLNTRISVLDEPAAAFGAELPSAETTQSTPDSRLAADEIAAPDEFVDVPAPDDEIATDETVAESATDSAVEAPEADAADLADATAEAQPVSDPPAVNPEVDLQATTAALAGAVPERDERAERLARMVRMRRGAVETEQQPVDDADVTDAGLGELATAETAAEALAEEPPAPVDLIPAPRAVPLPDVEAPVIAETDLAAPAAPDVAAPDVATPDLLTPELTAPELAAPEVAISEVTAPEVPPEPVLNFDAPEIPAGVDVFASLRETVTEAPKANRADPIDVLAALRDLPLTSARAAQAAQEAQEAQEGQQAEASQPQGDRLAGIGDETAPAAADLPTDSTLAAGAAPSSRATTPHDPPHQGGVHAADPDAEHLAPPEDDPVAPATDEQSSNASTAEQPTRAGKRRAATSPDDPPPNPAADDAIMALALEAVLRAEGRDAPGASAAPATATGKPSSSPATPRETSRPQARAAEISEPTARADSRPSAKPAPAPQIQRPYEAADEDESLTRKHRPPARSGVPTGGVPALVEFAPQRSTQHLLAMFMFLSLVATVGTGYLAYDSRAITEIAIAAFCGVLTLILWSAHSTAAPPRIKIVNGTLEVRSKDSHHRFDLTSPYTDLVTAGTPGRRNWKVSIARKSMRAFVIDSTMVDGREFMPILEACQAEARRRATDSDRRRHGQ